MSLPVPQPRSEWTVAVIVPTKDRPQFLDEAIASALVQTHAPHEIIVVDDGSAVPVDANALRQRHGDKVAVLRNATNRGLAYSRNRGVDACAAPGVVEFDRQLLPALLQTVPSAFQRVMTRTDVWHRVSALRRRVYRLDATVPDEEAARRCITGPLRDSEWAIYAAAVCTKTCLVRKPLYLARCEGQGGSSQPAMRAAHAAKSADIKAALLAGADVLDELHPYREPIRESLATVHFDAAYQSADLAQYRAALHHCAASFRLHPQWRHLKLLARIGLHRWASTRADHGA